MAAAPPVDAAPVITKVSTTALGKSWVRGCPVSPSEVRRVTVNYYGLDGQVHRGMLMVHNDVAASTARLFSGLYAVAFPIERLAPLGSYGGSMTAAEQAGATYGFGCAKRSDGTWDPQSLGRTLTVNPRQNPMYTGKGSTRPVGSRSYVDRKNVRPGMLVAGGRPNAAIRAAGWLHVRFAALDAGHLQAAAPPTARPRVERVTATDLRYSYRSGCPVGPSGLRRVLVYHWDFGGKLARGEIIVRASAADDISRVFSTAYAARFPIRKMLRVDTYRASDQRSMAADNTSAFNCRKVTGNPYRLSQHSYGNAIDINTFENPYVTASRVYPPGSGRFLDRSPYRKGMILSSGSVARAFRAEGWPWGARWSNPDYQHFSSNGG
jgi:hypothetical protein